MPFNPDRVLRDIPEPPIEPVFSKANEVTVQRRLHDELVRTPATPVSAEALASLRNVIIQQDAYSLDETSKQRLQRHVQKLASATQMFLAKSALQQDQIQFLTAINNEAKLRRSTKSIVLGKAKVMSYEDLVAKRLEREAKEQDKAKPNRKRGRKQKGQNEAGTPEPVIEEQSEEGETAPEEPYRAPMAQMW